VARESLSPEHRRYLIVGFCLIPTIINPLINGLIGWITFRGQTTVPLWALQPSIGADTLGTCFFLPAITCLIVTPIVRRHLRRGTIEPVDPSSAIPTWLRFARRPLVPRAAVLGAVSLASVGPASAVLLSVAGIHELALAPFLGFKAAFSALLGAFVTPLIALLALGERPDATA
jgi:hypothetical protein